MASAARLDRGVGHAEDRARLPVLRDAGPVATLASQLAVKGEGQVSFVIIKDGAQGEVEVALPDRYRIGPREASAMRAVSGVVEVELV